MSSRPPKTQAPSFDRRTERFGKTYPLNLPAERTPARAAAGRARRRRVVAAISAAITRSSQRSA